MASTIDAIGQKAFSAGSDWWAQTLRLVEGWIAVQQRQLILFLPVAFAGGIALWFGLPFNPQRQAAILLAVAIALAGLGFRGFARAVIVLFALAMALGMVAAELRSAQVAAPRLHHRLTAYETTGTVLAIRPHDGGARHAILLRRDATSIDPEITIRLAYRGEIPPWLRPGARVSALAAIGPPPGPALPGAYDPSRRAWFEGVSATGRIFGKVRLLTPAPGGPPPLAALRVEGTGATLAALGPGPGGLAVALIFGEQGHLKPDLLDAMRTAGLAHLLTVSGFHVAVVVSGMFLILRRLLALWPWFALRVSVMRMAAIGAGLSGTCYALLSGADLPAVRAAIAAWVALVALMLGRDPLSLRLIGFAALLILMLSPEALLNPSFQLSFAAVTALAALSASPLGQRLKGGAHEGPTRRLARYGLALLITGLVVEIALMPIALAHFGRAGVYGLLANLLAIPLTGFVIMPLLGLWLGLSALGLGFLIEWPLRLSLDALASIGETVARWPGASLQLPAMPGAALAFMLAGGLLAALLVGRARWFGLPLVCSGLVIAALSPRPNLFISADGRQVAVVQDGRLFTLRGHREGYLVSSWAEQAAAAPTARLRDLPGASCSETGCHVPLPGLSLMALLPEDGPVAAQSCARADLVTSPAVVHAPCPAGWQLLDKRALRPMGAVSIHTPTRRQVSVAMRAGDQPWSPAALPGQRPRLLGGWEWTGVIAE